MNMRYILFLTVLMGCPLALQAMIEHADDGWQDSRIIHISEAGPSSDTLQHHKWCDGEESDNEEHALARYTNDQMRKEEKDQKKISVLMARGKLNVGKEVKLSYESLPYTITRISGQRNWHSNNGAGNDCRYYLVVELEQKSSSYLLGLPLADQVKQVAMEFAYSSEYDVDCKREPIEKKIRITTRKRPTAGGWVLLSALAGATAAKIYSWTQKAENS